MTKKVIVHKGLTTKDPERDVYKKDYIGLEWDLPDEVDEATVAKTMIRMTALIDQQLGPSETKRAPVTEPSKVTVNHVKAAFPAQLTDMLMFEDTPEYVVIKPRQFLGSENFSKTAAVVRDQLGGEYISAGKESHFRIPKTEAEFEPAPQFNPEDLMKHQWKGRKQPDGSYAKGSLSWGWDFSSEFSKELLQILEKGPITIDKYEFSLSDAKNLVQTKKKK